MNRKQKWITAAGATFSLALAALTVSAHTDSMGGGMGQGAQGGRHHGMHAGQQHAGHGAKQRHGQGTQAAQALMTVEERTALREKMHAAKTPEERQQIAVDTRAEMQKRAAERGVTLPEHRGPRGRGVAPAAAPSTGEHVH